MREQPPQQLHHGLLQPATSFSTSKQPSFSFFRSALVLFFFCGLYLPLHMGRGTARAPTVLSAQSGPANTQKLHSGRHLSLYFFHLGCRLKPLVESMVVKVHGQALSLSLPRAQCKTVRREAKARRTACCSTTQPYPKTPARPKLAPYQTPQTTHCFLTCSQVVLLMFPSRVLDPQPSQFLSQALVCSRLAPSLILASESETQVNDPVCPDRGADPGVDRKGGPKPNIETNVIMRHVSPMKGHEPQFILDASS